MGGMGWCAWRRAYGGPTRRPGTDAARRAGGRGSRAESGTTCWRECGSWAWNAAWYRTVEAGQASSATASRIGGMQVGGAGGGVSGSV